MALKDFNKKDLAEMSNIDIARHVLEDNQKEMLFKDLLAVVNKTRGEELTGDTLSTFYADLNSDGAFISLGKQEWGMRSWYAVDSIDEATHDGFEDLEEEGVKKKPADEDVVGFDDVDEDEDVIDTEDDSEEETKEDDSEDETDEEDVSLNDDNQQLDVIDANNDLDDLGDGDVE